MDGMQKKRRRVSYLEMIPSEVLERIFLMSENLNLPRSSLHIGRALSARTHLLELVITAFQPTWDLWFGCPKAQHVSYYGYEHDLERMGGNSGFQTGVLACPWVDLSFILDAKQVWYRRHGRGRYFCHAEDWGFTPDGHPSVPDHPGDGQDHGKDVHACAAADWDAFMSAGANMSLTSLYIKNRKRNLTGYIDIHPNTRIPDELLSGPAFTWETAKFLFWLIHGGATLAPTQTWELTKEGFDRLMMLESDELVLTFLRLFTMVGVFGPHWPQHISDSVIKELELEMKDPEWYLPIPRSVVFAHTIVVNSDEVRHILDYP